MAAIAIVGGHGKVSRHLIPLLVDAGHLPVALIRDPQQAEDLTPLGAKTRLLDIENSDAGDFAAAFEGCTAVVFAAGGGPDGNIERKRTVDLEGSLKSIAAAEQAGIERFVQVSAIGVDQDPPGDAGEVWTAYVRAKRDADVALRESSLRWTIIRPGGLTDDEPTGKVTLAPEVERGEIPRADVAAVIASVIDDNRTSGKQWEVVGGETPIAQAVTAAVTA
ncbi:SDR family oxidoreductase [Aeromicrobium phragmitis]|uniref:SDR family oxidoreductase n=1 Tax=Aeromicrobium phragmitis TaxID=2478914 RepID=A0A3L8PLW5_9ACTN|nr:SDR family oxidoreductase [Aeromicrobium phragmitis]RLV56341.1 SDR family oxidoreductase [Aeromicrobium phragmitis]